MRRIGVTQRIEEHPEHGEVRDALDQAWARLLCDLGLCPVPLASGVVDAEGHVDALGLDGLILSGGNDLAELPGARSAAPQRDRFEKALLAHCERRGLPVLGVCRGMQLLCRLHGFEFEQVKGHVATHHVVLVEPGILDFWPERMEVNSFHRFAVKDAGGETPLQVVARDEHQRVEAVVHRRLRQVGVMWHPERGKRFRAEDLALLRHLFAD